MIKTNNSDLIWQKNISVACFHQTVFKFLSSQTAKTMNMRNITIVLNSGYCVSNKAYLHFCKINFNYISILAAILVFVKELIIVFLAERGT